MRPIRALAVLLLAVLVLAAPAVSAHHPPSHDPAADVPTVDDIACTDADPAYREFVTEVDGERAYGIFAAPDSAPTALVVIGHGAWHSVDSWQGHIEGLTDAYGTLTVAMEYRGLERLDAHLGDDPDHPEAKNWPERKGGEDLIAAAKLFQAACGVDTVILAGVSMGVSISGYAVSHLDPADHGLFDYWVTSEGVHAMLETYQAAKAAGSEAADWIEAETGGPYDPATNHDPYAERTNLMQTAAIEAAGLERVVYLHAVADGLVPYNQSREMSGALQVPFEFYTLTSAGEGSDGTSWTDYVAGGEGPLAGHASERDPDSLLVRATFDRIGAIATGDLADCGEYHVEEGAAFPDVEFRPLVTYDCAAAPGGGADTARPVHGAGWWDRGTGEQHDKVDFSFDVKLEDGELRGQLKVHDKDLGVRVDATSITSSSSGAGVDCDGVVLDGAASFAFTATGSFRHGGDEIHVAQFFACGIDNGKNNEAPVDHFHAECTAGCAYRSGDRTADSGIDGGNIHLRRGGDAASEVVELDPILLTTAPAGSPLVLTTTAPGGVLRWETATGDAGEVAPVVDAAGVAVFNVVVPAGDVAYTVWSGGVASNGVRVTGS